MSSLQTTQVTGLLNSSTRNVGDCLSKGTSGDYQIEVYLLTTSPNGPLEFHIYNNSAEKYVIHLYNNQAFGDNLCGKYSEPLIGANYNKLNTIVSESTLPETLIQRFQQGIKGATVPSAMDVEI